MTSPDSDLMELFRDETNERLDEMDEALLSVESGSAGPETVTGLFRNAHTIKGAAGMMGFDDIRVLAHAVENLLAKVRDSGEFPASLAGPLLRATSALRAHAAGQGEPVAGVLDQLAASGPGPPAAGDGNRATAPPPAQPPPPAGAAPGETEPGKNGPGKPQPGETPPEETPPGETPPEETPPGGPSPERRSGTDRRTGADRRAEAARRTVRVPVGKIDHLLNLVGEVMQERRRLTHTLGEPSRLSAPVADQLGAGERMLNELKDSAVGMRTLPVAAITGRLPHAVRDMATEAGKQVEFTVTGAGTEIDRAILESLSEPLTHLLRNSVVHGIEPPPQREQAGKPPAGRIELRAVPRGSLVEIVVADDGRGVSAEAAEAAHGGQALAEVLSREGYSTAAEVTSLAGRGVGVGAVNSYVQSLGGSFEIRSEPGHGMECVLLLPLALALLEVLIFRRGRCVYGLPLAGVEEAVLTTHTSTLQDRPSVSVRGRPLPVADIAAILGADEPPLPGRSPALIVSGGGRRIAMACDALLGGEEVVVKPLGPALGRPGSYLGAAILGNGAIALLLEPAAVTRGARRQPAPATAPAPAIVEAPKVMVVEDSFTVRELQRSILEAAGYRVVTARDGNDALAALDREDGVALVLTDLEMPDLDGLGLTRAIRADTRRAAIPVIIVTSRGSEQDRRLGIEAGADAYVAKQSFDQQALLGTVARLIGG